MKVMSGIENFCLLFTFVSLLNASPSNNLNFAVDEKYSTELKLSWNASSISGTIKEFGIECSRKNKSEIVQNQTPITSNLRSYTIKGLGSYKKYTCELIVYRDSFVVAARASLNTRTLRGDICSQPLGLENGALPDDQIEFPKNDNDKKIYRLNSIGNAFKVSTNDVILSFDFKRIIKVTGFATTSLRNTNSTIALVYQTFENKTFKFVGNISLQGSKYTYRIRSTLYPLMARYLRFIHRDIDSKRFPFRVEFYGCSEVCSNLLKHENITLEKKRVESNPELYSNEKVCLNQNEGLYYSFCNTVKLSGISILNKITMGSQKIKLQILCSMNGRNFTAVDQSRLFGGTVDAGDVLTSWLVTEQYCQHIQLILVTPLNICLQVQLLGCQSGCVDKLGIEKNEKGIKYTASSYDRGRVDVSPDKGRLNNLNDGWVSDSSDTNGKRFWQACLNNITLISGVYVQVPGFHADYIEKFLVSYSYKEVDKNSTVGLHEYTSNGSLVIFSPNRYGTNFYKFPTPIYARCLRLYVNCTRSDRCAARFEFGGCKNVVTGPPWTVTSPQDCGPKFQTTQTFINLKKTKICSRTEPSNCSSVSVVAKNLTVVTANNSIKTQQDVKIITDTINNIVNNINTSDVNQTRQVVYDILTTYNNILDVDPNIIGKSQTVSSSSTDLLENLDVIANQLRTIINQDKNFSSLQIAKKNIAFDIRSTLRKNISVVGSSPAKITYLQLQISETIVTNLVNKDIIASIEIPSTSFPNDHAIIHTTLFDKPSFFIPGEKLRSISGEDVSTSQIIETGVISFSFGTNVTIENLTIPIIIRLKRRLSSDGLNVCVFWDFNLPSGITGVRGDWSTRGCKYAGLDTLTGLSICECNHLTNFALLLDVSQTGNNPFELQIVTWIGCAISIFGVVMTIISSLIFRKLLKKLPQKILVSLCISLLALLIVFLTGAEQTSPRLGCQIVAGLLHYLILTTFCWMFIEAISLYRSFITVFKSGSQTKFFWKASAFAWGVPAVIVAMTAGIDHEYYGNDRICTLLGNAFYFAVLLPVILILVVNIIVLVAVMDVLVRMSSKRVKRLRKYNNPFAAVRIAFACNALLGATWIFAVLAVKDATTTFQWLFCIFNSLQGFFIFIFYTVRNNGVRNEWRRLLGLARKDGGTSTGKFNLKLTATSKKGAYNVSTSNSEKTKSTAYSSFSSVPS